MASLNIKLTANDVVSKQGFKYHDISTDITTDKSTITTLKDLQSVINGIRNIFTWNKGQRILLPEFGTNLRQYLYEPLNSDIINKIKTQIKKDVETWEPRAVINVNILNQDPDEHFLEFEMEIRVPTLTDKSISIKQQITE